MRMPEEKYMRRAFQLAREAGEYGDVPVGCVIVKNGEMIAEGKNAREKNENALHHAEIEAINKACAVLKTRRLSDCEIYVSLEPCLMCAGAIMNAQIGTVVFGAYDRNTGACGGVLNVFEEGFSFKPKLFGGFLQEESAAILNEFFEKIR